MSTLLQFVFNGLSLSSAYALVALGLTLIFGVMQIKDFAQGALFTVGGYIGYFALTSVGVPYFLALPLVFVLVGGLATFGYFVAYRPLEQSLGANTMIAALGILIVLENTVLAIGGSQFRYLTSPFGSGRVTLLDAVITHHRLFVIGVTLALFVAVWMFLHKTRPGKALRALSENRVAARLHGIRIGKVSALAFAIAGGLAGTAGVLMAPIQPLSPTAGSIIIVKAFAIVIFAGLGSVPGVLAASFVIGMGETLTVAYLAAQYADLVAFALLIAILLRRPEGLFGST